jgi:hypothetical protein
MSRSRGSGLLAAIALFLLPGAGPRAHRPQTSPDIDFRNWTSVAGPLVQLGATAGVVMCGLPPATDGDPVEDLVRLAGSPILAACTELNASLVQRRESGVLHIRTSREPQQVTDLLHRSIDLEADSGVPAIEAVATRIVNAVRGNASAGKTGSTGVISQPVTLRGGSTTFVKALDDVVRQAPGLVWYLSFTPTEGGRLFDVGLMARDGGMGVGLFQPPKRGCAPACPP